MPAERNFAALFLRRQQVAPAVLRHLEVIDLGPALGVDGDRGAQINERLLEASRPHGHPPADVPGMPRPGPRRTCPTLGEVDVVRDSRRVVDVDDIAHTCLLKLCAYRMPVSVRCRSA